MVDRKYWTVGQIAETFQVGNATVRVWLRDGVFPNATKTRGENGKGQWRVPDADVRAYAERGYGSGS